MTGENSSRTLDNRKALFFDVDGTLVDGHGQVPASASAAIHEARARGALVFINSGRTYKLASVVLKQVEADGLLCGCGTDLRIGGRQLEACLLPQTVVDNLRADYEAYQVDLFLEGPDGTLCAPNNRLPEAQRMQAFLKSQGGESPYDFSAEQCPMNKFCMLTDERSRTAAFLEKYSSTVDVIDRGGGFYECIPKGYGKGRAVRRTVELLHLNPAETYAFGDSTNDLDMLRAVAHPVVMGQHDAALTSYAEFITRNLEDDGIAFALRQYGLIE